MFRWRFLKKNFKCVVFVMKYCQLEQPYLYLTVTNNKEFKSNWNCAWNLESVYFKELHNEQEYYWPNRAGAAVMSTITSCISFSSVLDSFWPQHSVIMCRLTERTKCQFVWWICFMSDFRNSDIDGFLFMDWDILIIPRS